MKRARFSEQQITYIQRPAEEGRRVEKVCRKAGLSEATYYNWRKKYGGGLMPLEMKWLKQLDEENQRLKKLVADLSLDKAMLLSGSVRWSPMHESSGRSVFGARAERCHERSG